MACLLYNTGKCLQLRMFNRPNFGVHFTPGPPNACKGITFLRHHPDGIGIRVLKIFNLFNVCSNTGTGTCFTNEHALDL
jgi:hypothetical protein